MTRDVSTGSGSFVAEDERDGMHPSSIARLRRDAAELAVSSPESTRGYVDVLFFEAVEEEIVFLRDETRDPATPRAAHSIPSG